jgi:hypothetical protein|tara:strand:+ start:309 stop:731 length:423 start_codon:yes stop_codon:yes gene_type:complete
MSNDKEQFDADKMEAKLSQEVQDQYKDSTMSKGAKLAMELNAERKRLKQEMEELQLEVDDLKPATPTGTIDSYVKWVATIFAVVGVFLISAGLITEGQIAYAISACAWVYVGHCWNDKAIMIGSAITGTSVMMNLVEKLI